MTPNHSNLNFKGQLVDEQVICFTRKHWLRTFMHFFALAVLVASPIVLALFFDKADMRETLGQGGYFAVASIYAVGLTYLVHMLFVNIFNYYLRIIIVTNQRVIDLKKTLFLRDHRATVVLSEIQDITMDKAGIMQTIFNYGTIQIVVSGSSQTLELHYVPNPDYHFRKMIKSRQEYIARLAGVQSHISPIADKAYASIPNGPVLLPHEPAAAQPLILPTFTAQ